MAIFDQGYIEDLNPEGQGLARDLNDTYNNLNTLIAQVLQGQFEKAVFEQTIVIQTTLLKNVLGLRYAS